MKVASKRCLALKEDMKAAGWRTGQIRLHPSKTRVDVVANTKGIQHLLPHCLQRITGHQADAHRGNQAKTACCGSGSKPAMAGAALTLSFTTRTSCSLDTGELCIPTPAFLRVSSITVFANLHP